MHLNYKHKQWSFQGSSPTGERHFHVRKQLKMATCVFITWDITKSDKKQQFPLPARRGQCADPGSDVATLFVKVQPPGV